MQPSANFQIFEKRRGLFYGDEQQKVAVYQGKQYNILFERSDPKRLRKGFLLLLKIVASLGTIFFFKSFRSNLKKQMLIYSTTLHLSQKQSAIVEKILSMLSSKKFLAPFALSRSYDEDFIEAGSALLEAKLIGYGPLDASAQTSEEFCIQEFWYVPREDTLKKLLKMTPRWIKKLDPSIFSMKKVLSFVKTDFYCRQPEKQHRSEESYFAFVQDLATFELLSQIEQIKNGPEKNLEQLQAWNKSLPKESKNRDRFLLWRLGCQPTFTKEELEGFRQIVNFRNILFP